MATAQTVRSFDKVKIAFDVRGTPGAGPLGIVLACSNAIFRDFSDVMSRSLPNVMMDMRGSGKSERPKNRHQYSVRAYADDIEAVIEANKATQAVVIAYSHAVEGAIHLALNKPEAVKALILIEPPLFSDQNFLRERLRLAEEGNIAEALRLTFEYANPRLSYVELEDGIKLVMKNYAGSKDALVGEFRARALFNAEEDQLAHIRVPTLVIGGTRSNLKSNVARTARAIPNASMVWLDGADHFLSQRHIAKAVKIVTAFVENLD